MIHLSFIVPAHNEGQLLEQNVRRLVERLGVLDAASVYIVENGSRDATWSIAERLAGVHGRVVVESFREPKAGLGGAYDRALRELEARLPTSPQAETRHWVVLGAADLPFGFSDLDRALPQMARPDAPPVLLGSQAHRDSRIAVSLQRRTASLGYRAFRRALLGMRVGDCQGSLFLRAELAVRMRPFLRSRDYFYTTELVYFIERLGIPWLELPVDLTPDERKSTVNLVRDSLHMGRQLFKLWQRSASADDLPPPEVWRDLVEDAGARS